jgi:hypothetical protein
VPIVQGTGTCDGHDYPLDGSVALVEVCDFRPSPASSPHSARRPNAVHIRDINYKAGSVDDTATKFVIRAMLEEWCNAHLQEFNHVFAAISVNEAADTGSFAWLKPHDQGYANAKTGEDTGLFGVLAMTGDRTRGSLPLTISPFAIPPGADSGLLIAPERVLKDLVAPAMSSAFSGTTAADFELVNDNETVLRNTRAMTVPVDAGWHYTGKIAAHGFTVTIRGSEIILEIRMLVVEMSPGINVLIHLHEYLKVTTKPKSDGTNALWFEQVDSRVETMVDCAPGVPNVIPPQLVRTILLVACAYNASTNQFMAQGLSRFAAPMRAIEWPNQSGLKLVSAEMCPTLRVVGSLRLGLDPEFAH